MNTIYKRITHLLPAVAVVIALGLGSCVGDLDVDPTIDKSTVMEFNNDAYFAKIYANMALTGQTGPAGAQDIADIDEGTSDFFRQIWNMNELPTDEAICSWGDPGIPEYNFNSWSASHGMITCEYYRLYFGITLANDYLVKTAEDTSAGIAAKRAEARFLRALYYAYAIDFFGDVPFMTTLLTENAKQAKRADVYKFCVEELLDCQNDMAEPQQNTYGRADKAAAWLLLARLYLNAEVYTGTADWENAAIYADKVMKSGYSLCPNYQYLFMGDNNVNGAEKEVILPILQDGIDTQNYGGSLFLIASTHKDDMGAIGTSENWAGNRARRALVEKFFPKGDAPATDEVGMVAAANDDRALFFGKDRKLDVEKPTLFTDGYSVAKFTNLYSTGKADQRDEKFVDMDVPFMRLAEAYLTYAEAQLHLNQPDKAKDAIDALRDRAHASKQAAYSLDDVCDEWAREFYFEGRRRMDLVRFNKFGGATVDYKWEWKGSQNAPNGTTFPATRNIFGIPTNAITANDNLTQNPGY